MGTSTSTELSANPDTFLVTCPSCNRQVRRQLMTFKRGMSRSSIHLSSIVAPFIKPPGGRGHYCEYCRCMFNIERDPMPPLYYAWLAVLTVLISTLMVILYLLLRGN